MTKKTLLALAAFGLSAALAVPVSAGPNGNGPPDRTNPDDTRPGNRGGNGGGNGGGPPDTPPGLGGNHPPGHGGANPGNGGGNSGGNGHGAVSRNHSSTCGDDGEEAIGPVGQSGNSHVAHVNFAAEEGSDNTSWARMTWFWIGTSFDYVLNAHQVEPGSEWTLVARAEDGSAICVGEGTANPGGNLHLAESIELDSHLPDGLDPFAATPEGEEPAGATLELIATDAVDCEAGSVTADVEGVLTSESEIRFVDVDEVVCPE